MPEPENKGKKITIGTILAGMLILGSQFFSTEELEQFAVNSEISFATEQEYQDTKTQMTDDMISDIVILKGADPYFLVELLLYERDNDTPTPDYDRAKIHVAAKYDSFYSGGVMGQDEWIVTQAIVGKIGTFNFPEGEYDWALNNKVRDNLGLAPIPLP